MQNRRHYLIKIIFTFLYLVLVYVRHVFGIPCIYLYLFHIKCPGCGMTRSMLSVLRGDFRRAFLHNPMFWSVPILYIFFLMDGHVFKNKYKNYITLGVIFSGFAAVFIYRLFMC
ncbi:MAG: DUF2752 domain-containing protein [Oscillospiraceae bacterium]|nr:DUF2752 domain-containing protein [Oscillospiraceae bacterium]